ncbi:uncharacterized protein LOC105216132 [Zeugodacus cucurbitae]|uniref:Protein atonal homolog 8 n=1 Tax=Zeugodacus cucurbitae TaxID=28588 RepID=A0A0A1WFH0_ZEUCU|nr:uncharacterized protein LOC105216132 [Zeugodacus cucurbitae]
MANTKAATATATASATTISGSENQFCMQLNASELTAIIMKGSPNSNDRDAGFCSGSSEGGDDLDRIEHARLVSSSPTSPTDATTETSEDSVEVKVTPIALVRNKRKSSEPSKVVDASATSVAAGAHAPALATAPLKKRIRYTSTTDSAVVLTPPALATPPPPAHGIWDPSQVLPHELMPNPAQVFVRHPGATTLHRIPATTVEEQLEPLALVAKKPTTSSSSVKAENEQAHTYAHTPTKYTPANDECAPSVYVPKKQQATANSQLKFHASNSESVPLAFTANAHHLSGAARDEHALQQHAVASGSALQYNKPGSSADEAPSGSGGSIGSGSARPQQRNYKNMTRERRIEANARERTRVHTISAAYETLRRAVPSYSNAQKLSKLSVLRIACSYILTLSRMAGEDYSADGSEPSLADCFDAVTETIQTEGKIRKKKDE